MLSDAAIELMVERGTYLVPTSYLADAIDLDRLPAPVRAKAEHVMPLAKQSLRKAIAAGVPIAFGTDAAVFPHGDNAREFAVLGDTVNVASRLEQLSRELDCRAVISDAAAAAAQDTEGSSEGAAGLLQGLERRPDQVLRGREQPVGIWVL